MYTGVYTLPVCNLDKSRVNIPIGGGGAGMNKFLSTQSQTRIFQNKVSGQDFFLSFDDTGVCFFYEPRQHFREERHSIFFCHPEGEKTHKSDRLFKLSGHVACHGDMPSPEKEANLIEIGQQSLVIFSPVGQLLLLNRISSLGNF